MFVVVFSHRTRCRKLISSQATRPVSGAGCQTATFDAWHPHRYGLTFQVLPLAGSPRHCQAGDIYQMASICFSRVLEMEVSEIRPTTAAKESADAHLADGVREPDLGRRAYCERTKGQVGDPGLTADGRQISQATRVAKMVETRTSAGASFVRNQANVIVACDFFVSVSLTFRFLYVFVAMEIGSRRILHCNVTAHPTTEWTTQQFRRFSTMFIPTNLSFTITIRSFRPHWMQRSATSECGS